MKRLLPLLVLLAGFGGAALLVVTGPTVQPQSIQAVPPLVRTVVVEPKTQQFVVRTHGSVLPRTQSDLISEVDGRVIEMSPQLVSGGFFAKGDRLLRIDPLDYDVALQQARAGLARARSDLTNARKNHTRQQDLIARGAISDAQKDDALNRVTIAQATLAEAKAILARAQRDRARTEILAPYDGRVRSERVDIGQFVKRGSVIGTIYAVDFAEVRLPIHDSELAYLDLPLNEVDQSSANFPEVTLSATFAGQPQSWRGQVVRTEGELDPDTRMVHVVARIKNPYASQAGQAPLAVGLFVDAQIYGESVDDVSILPRSALRDENHVLVVDEASRLRMRQVNVLRLADDEVYIGGSLRGGERVCVSALQSATDGMEVRVFEQSTDTASRSDSDLADDLPRLDADV